MTDRDEISQEVRVCPRMTGDEMRAYRRAFSWSQATLAIKLDVSRRTVEEWESERNPSPYYLRLALERLAIEEGAQTAILSNIPYTMIPQARAVVELDDAAEELKRQRGTRL